MLVHLKMTRETPEVRSDKGKPKMEAMEAMEAMEGMEAMEALEAMEAMDAVEAMATMEAMAEMAAMASSSLIIIIIYGRNAQNLKKWLLLRIYILSL